MFDFTTPITQDTIIYASWTPLQYTVTFNSNGGSSVASKTVSHGSTVSKPSNPTKSGYTFVNWYTNSSLTSVYNFSTAVTGNLTLYAKWETAIPSGYTIPLSTGGTQNVPLTLSSTNTSYISLTKYGTFTDRISFFIKMNSGAYAYWKKASLTTAQKNYLNMASTAYLFMEFQNMNTNVALRGKSVNNIANKSGKRLIRLTISTSQTNLGQIEAVSNYAVNGFELYNAWIQFDTTVPSDKKSLTLITG